MTTTYSTAEAEVDPLKRGETHINAPDSKPTKTSWRDKFYTQKAKVPGKENWRDATLSEKERWKEWQKAKDKEQARGYVDSAVFSSLGDEDNIRAGMGE
ncbi:hypothetical protein J1614_007373 [Plenodomus biglobosus]|nr:hypothetical protein J1614_007373 [Plenodomus biglobosus]